ncbi:MAG: hypothetical protein V3V01_05395 [Acidimicrobiales bacterium]
MHRPLPKVLIAAATITMVFFGLITPVSAQDATAVDNTEIRQADPSDEVQHLRLRCRGKIGRSDQPLVRCKWSRPKSPSAAVTVVERIGGDSDSWTPIYRTENIKRHRFVDKSIDAGVRYRYRVRVYDSADHLVAASRSRSAGVPAPGIDVLKIACKGAVSDSGDKTAGCEWSPSENARSYQLWRIVNRNHRDLVASVGADVQTVRDIDVPDDAKVVRYAVLALDADGEIIGRSRVAKVRFRTSSESDQ